MPTAGHVTEWRLYLSDLSQRVVLQIWRFIRTDIEIEYQEMYALVNSTVVDSSCTVKRGITVCAVDDPYQVEAGDLIGFYFQDRNPLPYSTTRCYGRSEQLRFISNVRDPDFGQDEYGFSLGSYASNPCREYSVEVTVGTMRLCVNVHLFVEFA